MGDSKSDAESDTESVGISSVMDNAKWNKEYEKILSGWADKAWCYGWLHGKSHNKYSFLMKLFTIPIIIISTITGTANYAQNRVPVDYANMYVILIGTLNILVGIIGTVQQFLKINELNESHRVSYISWNKFNRSLRLELAKPPSERTQVGQLLKSAREEYDRLLETSPNIEVKVIDKFKKTFQNKANYKLITKPDICDELPVTEVYKPPKLKDIVRKHVIGNKDLEIKVLKDNKEEKKKKFTRQKTKEVGDIISKFENQHDRKPLVSEMNDLLPLSDKEKLSLGIKDEDDLRDYFNKFLKDKAVDALDTTIDLDDDMDDISI